MNRMISRISPNRIKYSTARPGCPQPGCPLKDSPFQSMVLVSVSADPSHGLGIRTKMVVWPCGGMVVSSRIPKTLRFNPKKIT